MNYEELNVFKESHKFVLEIYKTTETFPNEEKFRLVNQLIRASYSIPSNIAEGNSRNTTKDYINFLYNARGVPICCISPSFITTILSAIVIAST